ncbi:MAG: type II 3-dehydroquinate dehydratase [Chloroflexota bacterium]|nr:type II 3-dehydroquinate dehydratase [Chloroflexota bacterium]
MKKILVINGPNLNLLGSRDPEIYGTKNLGDVENMLNEYLLQNDLDKKFEVEFFQSNHEGDLIDYIQSNKNVYAIIVNPGGLTTVGFPLLDALIDSEKLSIEVHISDIHKREEFRRNSIFPNYCISQISGMGIDGYVKALSDVCNHSNEE